MIEYLQRGDRVVQGRQWGTVKQVSVNMVEVRWDRVGLMSRARTTWEPRRTLECVLPE